MSFQTKNALFHAPVQSVKQLDRTLLPDCMLIRKVLSSDWLDSGTWTIYTFPYRRSGPFIRLSIKVETQDFWEDSRETIDRSRQIFYILVTFGKLSLNFWKLSGKTFLAEFSINLYSAQTFPSMFNSEYFSQAINSLITGWTVYTKNINPLVLRIGLGLYIFPYRQSNQLLRR